MASIFFAFFSIPTKKSKHLIPHIYRNQYITNQTAINKNNAQNQTIIFYDFFFFFNSYWYEYTIYWANRTIQPFISAIKDAISWSIGKPISCQIDICDCHASKCLDCHHSNSNEITYPRLYHTNYYAIAYTKLFMTIWFVILIWG